MNEPIWWLRNTKPLSMDKYLTPKICATMAFVAGTVDNHSKPIAEANRYTLHGVSGSNTNSAMASERSA